MQVILSKPVIGHYKDDNGDIISRTHASSGDILDVILKNETHFICDSLYFSRTPIAVFPSQCEEILIEEEKEDEYKYEKYYNVYSKPEKVTLLNNDISYPEELEY